MIKDGSDAGGRLFSAMFSSSNPNLLAAAGELGTQIIDIRYSPNQRLNLSNLTVKCFIYKL